MVRPRRLPDGALRFECPLTTGHVEPGPLRWLKDAPPPVPSPAKGAAGPGNGWRSGGSSGLAKELGKVVLRFGPATGRWDYNLEISWWTLSPTPDWADRTSWKDVGETMDYVPGSTE